MFVSVLSLLSILATGSACQSRMWSQIKVNLLNRTGCARRAHDQSEKEEIEMQKKQKNRLKLFIIWAFCHCEMVFVLPAYEYGFRMPRNGTHFYFSWQYADWTYARGCWMPLGHGRLTSLRKNTHTILLSWEFRYCAFAVLFVGVSAGLQGFYALRGSLNSGKWTKQWSKK